MRGRGAVDLPLPGLASGTTARQPERLGVRLLGLTVWRHPAACPPSRFELSLPALSSPGAGWRELTGQPSDPLNMDPILKEDTFSMPVRVLPGCAVRARDDKAPSVSTLFTEGQVIPNLDLLEAMELIIHGFVEATDGW